MPDPTATPGATPDPGATPGAVQEQEPVENGGSNGDVEDLGEAGQATLAKIRKEKAAVEAQLNEAQAALREREDAERTELEKITAERDRLKAEHEALRRETLARSAAASAGMDPEDWHILRGESAEELQESAKAFTERYRRAEAEAARPDLGSGPRTGSAAPTTSGQFSDRIRQQARRR